MNIEQINSALSITDLLASQGIQPARKRGSDWWYISPIRTAERTPSFKVNTRLNRWYDHGTGEGGKVFDLALRLHRTATIREVIQLLSRQSFLATPTPVLTACSAENNLPPKQEPEKDSDAHRLRVLASSPLEEKSRMAVYLRQRGVSLRTAAPYCREVDFSINARQHSAIGFENRSGGYELRNAWFKGSSSPKDITYIDRGTNTVCLLEGFMDFLSLLELWPHLKESASFLVLNSLTQLGKGLEVLGRHRQVLLFLDHDPPGRKVTERLLRSELNCQDVSALYRGHKDVNAYLVAGQRQAKRHRLSL
ncbi:toprim domain-containing protein [Pontibacter sp. H249]|uniref:toprim domain-containing protein n=1 Tax=Pontibacter sp. H249 TaxID=3133420 RepID=UPI0030BA7749